MEKRNLHLKIVNDITEFIWELSDLAELGLDEPQVQKVWPLVAEALRVKNHLQAASAGGDRPQQQQLDINSTRRNE